MDNDFLFISTSAKSKDMRQSYNWNTNTNTNSYPNLTFSSSETNGKLSTLNLLPNSPRKSVSKGNAQTAAEAKSPRDYIHVRARRGQATDSHSLAERVRREKISERMKYLQDLVPACNKVFGKALVLDEIINYVHSLQRQVEFLSMRLASVNMDSLFSEHMFQSNYTSSLPHPAFPFDPSISNGAPNQSSLDSTLCTNLDGFGEGAHDQFSTFYQDDDDLQSIVQMGFSHNVQESAQL